MKNLSTLFHSQLVNQYPSLLEWLTPFDNKFIKQRFRQDKWSIHEHLAHLGRYQEIFWMRMEKILKNQDPHFSSYKAEQDEEYGRWCQKETVRIIQNTQLQRQLIIHKIESLEESDFQKIGYHPKLKKLHLVNWIEFFLLHESHHLYTIFRMLHEFGKSQKN